MEEEIFELRTENAKLKDVIKEMKEKLEATKDIAIKAINLIQL